MSREIMPPSQGGSPLPGPNFTNGLTLPPRFPTATAAIIHHVLSIPEEVAAIDNSGLEPRTITYAQLGRRAVHLARSLQALGVRPGHRVPLVVKRGLEMTVGIVAVLLCGAQYVPLDGGVVPRETLRRVVEQSGGKVVLCLDSTAHRIAELGLSDCKPVVIDEDERDIPAGLDSRRVIEGSLMNLTTAESGCYVIYTSGTTGTPKGVDVTHANVANLLCAHPGDLGIRKGVRVGQVLSISFDMAAWEILGCFCNGGTLVLRGSDWAETVRKIDVLICTPSILARFSPEEFPNLRTVATAGEPISVKLADLWASHLTYYNCCGPTETTIVNTMQRHRPGQPLSIGKPTPNNRVYILDDQLRQVPIGTAGIIWAGGKGVTRGYVGLPELTSEKYILDKFANDGTMMYNTGDAGLWREDGTIQIQGRCDDQVKIKGFRVELDGVAACLTSSPEVAKAVVLQIDGELHAFLTPKSCHTAAVRETTKSLLPYYAQPSHYHALESFPLTHNGKIDKASLRNLVESGSDSGSDSGTQVHSSPSLSSGSTTTLADSESGVVVAKVEKESSEIDLDAPVPEKNLPKPFRGLIHRVFIPYRFLFTLVWLANAAAAIAIYMRGPDRDTLGNMVAVNLSIAVLVRQDIVINALYTIFCSAPKSWPLWFRTSCGKIFHLGGVHSSAASCSAVWLIAANVTDAVCISSPGSCPNYPPHSLAYKVLSWILAGLFLTMLASAYPSVRKANHNLFEMWHRFTGWTMLALFWAQTVVGVHDAARASSTPFGIALCSTPAFWLLVAATGSVALSWCWLRRVPVVSEVLSDHAIRLHFDYTTPVNGSFTRLSFRPLLEWHSFATIGAPKPHGPPEDEERFPAGYSLVVSNAGDWTRYAIRNPPTHMWVRGLPTCGVMRIATLFNRVVVVATGSGIGPCLGHIQDPSCATQVFWSTKNPVKTFGKGLVDSITAKVPDAVIWDTNERGRPDMVRVSYNMAKDFKAEAVIVIANEKITKKIVYGLETRGIAAYGAIWDS